MNLSLYNATQVRELDRSAIEGFSIPSYTLMSRAGLALLDLVQLRFPAAQHILIVCGAGNNGGDGYVLGRLLVLAQKTVTVYSAFDTARLSGDAKRAHDDYLATGKRVLSGKCPALQPFDLIVDALFGSGLCRTVEGTLATLIEQINASGKVLIAVDVPSGLDASSGTVLGVAVRADVTATFIGNKRGLMTNDGPDHSGVVFTDTLGVPGAVFDNAPSNVSLIDGHRLLASRPARRKNTHKGSYGSIIIAGGNHGMEGAALLAATAALKCGAGLVKVATRRALKGVTADADLIRLEIDNPKNLEENLAVATVLATGPGLGQDDWSGAVLAQTLRRDIPKVLDADALNLLANTPATLNQDTIITPHPAEAARLLQTTTGKIQADRFSAVLELAEKYNAIVVLKGCGTLVCDGRTIGVCAIGNPGMACAGMGDVLTGIIAGLLGQGLAPYDAACLGVWLHANAGDLAYVDKGNGLLASDIANYLATSLSRYV